MPPAHPLVRLEQLAREIDQFATRLEAETDLPGDVIRDWAARLIDIGRELQGSGGRQAPR
jgi:hypothetical protein